MGWLELGWKILVARGVVGAFFGAVAVVGPLETVEGVVLAWGLWALAEGAATLVAAVQADTAGARFGYTCIGVVSLLAAFFATFQPVSAESTLTSVVGIWLVARGLVEVGESAADTDGGPALVRLMAAAVSLGAGALFLANPGPDALDLTHWVGGAALLWGVLVTMAGLLLRRQDGAPTETDPRRVG